MTATWAPTPPTQRRATPTNPPFHSSPLSFRANHKPQPPPQRTARRAKPGNTATRHDTRAQGGGGEARGGRTRVGGGGGERGARGGTTGRRTGARPGRAKSGGRGGGQGRGRRGPNPNPTSPSLLPETRRGGGPLENAHNKASPFCSRGRRGVWWARTPENLRGAADLGKPRETPARSPCLFSRDWAGGARPAPAKNHGEVGWPGVGNALGEPSPPSFR